MGLDIYFYSRNKSKSKQELDKQDVINEFISLSSNTELQKSLLNLKEYTQGKTNFRRHDTLEIQNFI